MKLIDQGVIITQKVQITQWLQKTQKYIPTLNETQQHETTAILTKLKLSSIKYIKVHVIWCNYN